MTEPAIAVRANKPHDDVVREAERLLHRANEEGVRVKLLGGVAVAILSPNRPPSLRRAIGDLDVITDRASVAALETLLLMLGYRLDLPFNAASGRDRRRLRDNERGRHLDIFVDRFLMCHEIPLSDRLAEPGATIPLPELLLTKLQVVELTEKDISDIYALTHERALTAPELERIAVLCAGNWGLWKTVHLALERSSAMLGASQLEPQQRQAIEQRLAAIGAAIDEFPKSRRWQFRARIGTLSRWYELPEEVQ